LLTWIILTGFVVLPRDDYINSLMSFHQLLLLMAGDCGSGAISFEIFPQLTCGSWRHCVVSPTTVVKRRRLPIKITNIFFLNQQPLTRHTSEWNASERCCTFDLWSRSACKKKMSAYVCVLSVQTLGSPIRPNGTVQSPGTRCTICMQIVLFFF
jgi:hypothetical protein